MAFWILAFVVYIVTYFECCQLPTFDTPTLKIKLLATSLIGLMTFKVHLTLWTPGAGLPTLRKLPYGARNLLTDGTVYQRQCQESVDRLHGI